jgi:hypothetical protein
MRYERSVVTRSYTQTHVFRVEAFRDGHICSEPQDVFVCAPVRKAQSPGFHLNFPEVSNTDRTATLNPGDDGQRLIVFAADFKRASAP